MSYIAYTRENKSHVVALAPGVTAEQAAIAMGLTGWREITDEEAAELGKPAPPTLEEQQAMFLAAIDEYMDAFARSRGYDDMRSAASWAGDEDPIFGIEGDYAKQMRSRIYRQSYAILGDVLSGKRPMPTIEEVLAELPTLEWPEQ